MISSNKKHNSESAMKGVPSALTERAKWVKMDLTL